MIFGHQTNDRNTDTDEQSTAGSPAGSSFIIGSDPVSPPTPGDHFTATPLPSAPPADVSSDDTTPGALNQAHQTYTTTQDAASSTISLSDESAQEQELPAVAPTSPGIEDSPAATPVIQQTMPDDTTNATTQAQPLPPANDTEEADVPDVPHADLLVLKQQALNDLAPLVNQLEQTPEEQFRTTMMMIQSTDNQALLKDAYAAAQTIEDKKVRAQALLDVVNEINYFTQKTESN